MITLNGVEVIPTIFPDGTSQVWKLDPKIFRTQLFTIVWCFYSESELMHLAQLKYLLDLHGYVGCVLTLPYLPYGRQDKDVSNEECFALAPFARLLDGMAFDAVEVFDAHSDRLGDMMRTNVVLIEPMEEIQKAIDACNPDLLCFPDSGARGKYQPMFSEYPWIAFDKVRASSTGIIEGSTILLGANSPKGKSILIVDDICDGGATFIKTAEMLYTDNAIEVNLYVSHGLFTKGKQVLRDAGIKRIFTKDGEQE
jgi:ribose-phosphate pyrophosphokinase